MSKILETLEEKLGKKASEWTSETMASIVSSEELVGIIGDGDLTEFVEDLSLVNKEFCDKYIAPACYMVRITESERDVSELIKEFETGNVDSPSEIIEKAKEFINDKNPFVSLVGYLTYINFADDDFKKYKDEIILKFTTTKDMLINGDPENFYMIDTEWLEVIYPLEQLFFEKTGEKLFIEDNHEELEAFQDKLNEFTVKIAAEFNEKMRGLFPDEDPDKGEE